MNDESRSLKMRGKSIFIAGVTMCLTLLLTSCGQDDTFTGFNGNFASLGFQAISSDPYNTQSNVGDKSVITITFSEAIDTTSVAGSIFFKETKGSVTEPLTQLVASNIQAVGNQIVIPTANFKDQAVGSLDPNARYTVEINITLRSIAGTPLIGLTTIDFCTGVCDNLFGFETKPGEAPRVIAKEETDNCVPTQNGTVNVKGFEFYFSEPVYAPIVQIGTKTLGIFNSGSGTYALYPLFGGRYDAWGLSVVTGTGFLQGGKVRIRKSNIRDFDGETGEQNLDGNTDVGCADSEPGCNYVWTYRNPIFCS